MENLSIKCRLGGKSKLEEKVRLIENKYVVDIWDLERKLKLLENIKQSEIEKTKKQMSSTQRIAFQVPDLQKQIKSLKVAKKKDDKEIYKIIRLGKQVDEKNKKIERLTMMNKRLKENYDSSVKKQLTLQTIVEGTFIS